MWLRPNLGRLALEQERRLEEVREGGEFSAGRGRRARLWRDAEDENGRGGGGEGLARTV